MSASSSTLRHGDAHLDGRRVRSGLRIAPVGRGRDLKGRAAFNAAALATFLEDGLAGVQERGGAGVGDKTLVDALAGRRRDRTGSGPRSPWTRP